MNESDVDRLLERFPDTPKSYFEGYHELRSALVALREQHDALQMGARDNADWAKQAEADMRAAWVERDALREKLARTEAEVDRLDGIRGDLVAELTEAHRLLILERDHKDEARRVAVDLRNDACKDNQRAIKAWPLPWELGAPAARGEVT